MNLNIRGISPSGQKEKRVPAASEDVTASCLRVGEKLLDGTYPELGLGDPPEKILQTLV